MTLSKEERIARLEVAIKMERELRTALFAERKEALGIALSAQEAARNLAAQGLSDHLSLLNHAHEQALQDRGAFVPRELYEAEVGALSSRLNVFSGIGLALVVLLPVFVKVIWK